MIKRLFAATAIALLVCSAKPAEAQSGMLWIQAGKHDSTFGNGATKTGVLFGGGVTATIAGGSDEHVGVSVPIGIEFKFGTKNGADISGNIDIGMRVRMVSFGPGFTAALINRPSLVDSRCLPGPLPDKSSCFPTTSSGKGERDIGGFFGLIPSFFGKVTFGPQGRAFAQMRYMHYLPGFTAYKSTKELSEIFFALAQSSGTDVQSGDTTPSFHPVDYPKFEHGHETRLSAGYVFGGGPDKSGKVVRVQYTTKDYSFAPTLANTNGMFNQERREVSVGFGVTF